MATRLNDPPWKVVTGSVRLTIRAAPGAARNRVALDSSQGTIKIYVTAAANDGKANAAVIKLLAKAWRLPRRDISLVHGATARTKVLQIDGDPTAVCAQLQTWLDNLTDDS